MGGGIVCIVVEYEEIVVCGVVVDVWCMVGMCEFVGYCVMCNGYVGMCVV